MMERLRTAAGKTAACVGLAVSHADLVSKFWTWQEPEDLDAEEILHFAQDASALAEALLAEVEAAVQACGARERSARRRFSILLGEVCRPIHLRPWVSPSRLSLLARSLMSPDASGRTLEVLLEVIVRLERLLERLPADSRAARGLRTAIAALRRILQVFDAEPVTIAFTAPPEGLMARSIPFIEFVLTDGGSGPDPASRRLLAVHTGPDAAGTTDLTSRTTFHSDPSRGQVVVRAEGLEPTTLQDGFLRLEASGTDFAGNPPATAVRNFVLDREGPTVLVSRPVSGEEASSTTVLLEVTMTDLVSGIEPSSISVTVNGTDVTGGITIETVSTTPLGHPREIRLGGTLQAAVGPNELAVTAADRAGNSRGMQVSFRVTESPSPPPVELEPEPVPVIILEKVEPDDPHAAFEGGYTHNVSGTLRVRARSVEGSPIGIRLLPRLVDGEGEILPARDLPMTTNEEGIGGFRIRFGRRAGPHTVEVTASNAVVPNPLRFTVEALPFPLVAIMDTDHRAGSGVLLDIHAPQGVPIRAFESDAQGLPVPPGQGKIVILDPEIVTERAADRRAVFSTGSMGYIVRPGITGPYFVTVEAVGLTDENGAPIRMTVEDSIPVLGPPLLTHVQIVSGQGQRGYPGRETPEPLVARLVPGTRPDLEPRPPDRIVFSVRTEVSYQGRPFLAGELVPVTGADPIIRGPGRLSLRAVGGVASVRFKPLFPVSALISIAPDLEPSPSPPHDFFIVGGPRVYLARRKFARDAEGRILRDGEGNASPSGDFEEIPAPAEGPEPFVRTADILDPAGRLKEPREVYTFFVQMETADYGERLRAGVMAAGVDREALELADGWAPTRHDLELERVSVQDGKALYRSGALALTLSGRKPSDPVGVSVLPGGVRLLQGERGAPIVPFVPFETSEGRGQLPGTAREGRGPMWVFLGDSLTIGTQAKSVVELYQKAGYAVQACRLANVPWWLAEIDEPGTPPRIWTDPRVDDRLKPDPTAPPLTDPTLFAELMGALSEPFGTRAVETYGRFANVLAIDGTEVRQSITQGRFSAGLSGSGPDPGAGSNFTSDFTLEVLAGMEAPYYDSRTESEWWLTQEVLLRNPSRGLTTESYELSQVEQARRAAPDLVSIFLGNNDTLQAVLNGTSIQARVTPFDNFNPDMHRDQLQQLQPVRELGLSDSIPALSADGIRNEALRRLGFVTMKSALDHIVSRLREVPAEDPRRTKRPDIVLMTLPDTTQVPILVPLTRGATLGSVLKRTHPDRPERMPFRIVFFGVDITDDIHDAILLDDQILEADPASPTRERATEGRFEEGTRVSLATVLDRFGRRLAPEIRSLVSPWGFLSDLRFIFRTRAGIRETVAAEVRANWTQGRNLRAKAFGTPFAFRRDQVLVQTDIETIQRTITRFNGYVREVAAQNGFLVFDVEELFKQAVSPEGFPVRDRTGAVVDRLRATLRGQLFSLDGGHPGTYGHLILAGELLEAIKQGARERGRDSFGGVHLSELGRPDAGLLAPTKEIDEAVIGARRN
jgi:lysophospholipase L1-like esterase